ncbi:ABC transporter substrate-binding protein [Cohnella thermotolerans]|uniref:ABC transporter substrate-binding protein n=1 Tax=Cohnella thermotolerans TaxID=329858 RepID=UPI00040D0CEB|nr:ABC transporter substrate-binding protein [Cohnella thermotolerans]
MGVHVKRSALAGLSAVFAFGLLLAGCSGKGNGEASPSASGTTGGSAGASASAGASGNAKTEPFTISVFYGASGPIPTENNKIYKKIRDELGVTLKEEYLVGDLEQKLGVMIAGGDYPDLITASPKLTAAKAVIPLEDLIEQYAPNIKKHYEKVWNMMKDPSDGHIYWLPNYGVYQGNYVSTYYSGPAFWIQKGVLKEFGYPKLKTLDDYFNLIEQYKAKHPEIDGQPTIGFTTLAYDWRKFPLLNAPEHLAGYPNDGGVVVDPKTNTAQIFADKEIAKKYYKKLNEENAKGIIDKEAFAQNYDQYLAKISSGRVLGMFDQHWNFQQGEDSLVTQQKFERTYLGIPLVYDDTIRDYYLDRPALNLQNGFGISVDAKDPVRILKFLDTLLDEKWSKVLNWGIEGEDYLVDDKGKFYRTPEMRNQQEDVTWKQANRASSFLTYVPKIEGQYSDGNATDAGSQPDEYFATLKDIDKELFSAYGVKLPSDFFSPAPENRISYPAWSIDLIDGSPAKIASTKLEDLGVKYLPKAILSKPEEFDSVWDEYVKQIGKVDVKAYEDRINEQLKYRMDNWSVK